VSDNISAVTDATFEDDVLKSEVPVLVDVLGGMVRSMQNDCTDSREIAAEYDGKIRIAKLNIDDNPATPPRYGIRGIPTLMYLRRVMLRRPRLVRSQNRSFQHLSIAIIKKSD